MTYVGCDLGTVAAKVVVMQDGAITAGETRAYKNLPRQAAETVMESVLSAADLSSEQIECCVATGFGKKAVSGATADAPEIVCISRAVRFLDPDVRTVIDVGGQSIRAFNIGANGKIIDSTANEKCL